MRRGEDARLAAIWMDQEIEMGDIRIEEAQQQ